MGEARIGNQVRDLLLHWDDKISVGKLQHSMRIAWNWQPRSWTLAIGCPWSLLRNFPPPRRPIVSGSLPTVSLHGGGAAPVPSQPLATSAQKRALMRALSASVSGYLVRRGPLLV
jgi:hypothetical protein